MYLGKDRKLNRWLGFDYNQSGCYFITICVKDRIISLGNIESEKMVLSEYGKICWKYWQEIPSHYENVELDELQIMPNHLHGIIIIKPYLVGAENVGTEQCSVPTETNTPFCAAPARHYGLLSKIIKL